MSNKNIGKYGNKFTSETAKSYQKLGAVAKKEKYLIKKEMRELLLWYLKQKLNPEAKRYVKNLFPDISERMDKEIYILAKQVNLSLNGNSDAFKVLLELLGVLP